MEILEKMDLNNGVKCPCRSGNISLGFACYDFAEAYNAQGR